MVFVPHLHRRFSWEQIEELKREINKTEYEKAREPLIHELGELEYKVYRLERMIGEYQSIISDILNSIEKDYITIYYQNTPFAVEFSNSDKIATQKPYLEKLEIPIKRGIKEHIYSRIIEVSRKEKD